MRDHLRLIVNTHTHTRSKLTLLPPIILLHFRCLHLSDVWCCAQQVVLVYQDYIIGISSYPWLLIVLRILLTRWACTLVISTRPTINLHATGEQAGVNFGHCGIVYRQAHTRYLQTSHFVLRVIKNFLSNNRFLTLIVCASMQMMCALGTHIAALLHAWHEANMILMLLCICF